LNLIQFTFSAYSANRIAVLITAILREINDL